LFSATMPKEILEIINVYMAEDATKVQVDKNNIVNKDIDHQFLLCPDDDKLQNLVHFLKQQGENRGIIFCKTKAGTQTLAKQLQGKNFLTEAIHGDLLQLEREKVMRAFKNTKVQILIATDMAARGIDVEGLAYVIHYQLPEQIEYYTHRSGRTARAGKKGLSLCLLTQGETKRLRDFEMKLGISFEKLRQ
jgi:ATP-dependent RNA helicase DeaD